MPWMLNLLYLPLALLYLPVLIYQMLILRKNRRGWRQRLGFVRARTGGRPCVWIHAVSLGEVNATRSLVSEIQRRLPAYDVVISATTDTGYAAAQKEYAPKLVFRYPLDFSFVVARVLRRVRPNAIVLMELEVWPNLLELTRRAGIPVGIANGRITEERSMRRFRLPLIRGVARRMFSRIAWIAAQDETFARRFVEVGASPERVTVCGALKYDTALIADTVPGADRLAQSMGIRADAPLVVAGSTGPDEEALLLDAYAVLRQRHPALQLAIVPRKPERFDEVARLIEQRGFSVRRRSAHPDLAGQDLREAERERRRREAGRGSGTAESSALQEPPAQAPTVLLGDTMGELRKFYVLASAVFVGRSLAAMGGSDVMEVAGLGRPMCFGPHMENFADAVEKLLRADAAIQIAGPAELSGALDRLVSDADAAMAMGRRAQETVRQNVGATRLTVDILCESLGRRADHPASSISTAKLSRPPA